MHVIATAGHVDHGKSTLVRALTGTDPDRLAEEQRRGLTIELGYAWTAWPGAGDVAFVDVPGHERFLTTMLAGVGPVPAALLVVAADDPWMPQSAEHLAALDALGVAHGVVAVTRSDLADPAPAMARAAGEVGRTSLIGAPVVAVSGRTGNGLDELRAALATMLARLPVPDPAADVRLWVDRRFTVRGAGTVVTGTLPAGTVRVGDTLSHGERTVRVRGVQALGRDAEAVSGTARVALNLTGDVGGIGRGTPLTTPAAWHHTEVVDVRLRGDDHDAGPPLSPQLHVGAADVAVRHRPLGDAADGIARLTLERPLPLRVGDRMVLRDPGRRALWRVDVLDPDPPRLRRRGASARRAAQLAGADGTPQLADELARRGLARRDRLRRIGVDPAAGDHLEAGPWLLSRALAATLAQRLPGLVEEHARAHPLDPDVPLTVLADRLRLPDPQLVAPLVRPPLQVVGGRVRSPGSGLPAAVAAAVDVVRGELATEPFAAPTADRLRELGLDDRALGAAERAGLLWRVAPGLVLLPGADRDAAARLARLEQPFTTSAARQELGTSRRVVLPLLDRLDRSGLTRRLADDRRQVAVPGVEG
ncbi:selenocysteine-specific translation elongation factor [Nocardioides sp. zg-1228]|uniref:selenocysteine-specific translation elongation factor n=1 Tax=Nocardioides sp. zg-1228 TaxID=2763008 RepID=UPI001643212C|nr:selenocysteine-specific translation elongation factor [Nocardioides sp. zg-1228]MBC2932190.1 selenocysteine-specific translation elongation factor [Nocardioides sp. zg-1228]QSF57727.1 selenocysteine-specific translation elongation factor [Nocardioides sp. zg-1228]